MTKQFVDQGGIHVTKLLIIIYIFNILKMKISLSAYVFEIFCPTLWAVLPPYLPNVRLSTITCDIRPPEYALMWNWPGPTDRQEECLLGALYYSWVQSSGLSPGYQLTAATGHLTSVIWHWSSSSLDRVHDDVTPRWMGNPMSLCRLCSGDDPPKRTIWALALLHPFSFVLTTGISFNSFLRRLHTGCMGVIKFRNNDIFSSFFWS